jgi:NADH:ubiquinone oxidoreductase subunit F (NADH-binding)
MTTILASPAGQPRPILGDAVVTIAPDGAPGRAPDLEAAIEGGAFVALRSVVGDLGPTGTLMTVAASGLRGRGGAGYPAGAKWRAVADVADPIRYVVGNGYEADPAQATNRVLMEARAFAVVEGIAIAALAVGAREAIIAVRAEYADAVAALEAAVFAAEEAGFLGTDILRSGRDVAVDSAGGREKPDRRQCEARKRTASHRAGTCADGSANQERTARTVTPPG